MCCCCFLPNHTRAGLYTLFCVVTVVRYVVAIFSFLHFIVACATMHYATIRLLYPMISAAITLQSHIASGTHRAEPGDMMYNTRSQGMVALLFAIDVSRASNYKCN